MNITIHHYCCTLKPGPTSSCMHNLGLNVSDPMHLCLMMVQSWLYIF